MVKNSIWTSEPLETAIITILQRRKAMRDDELFDALKQRFNGLSFREFNKALMKLEIWGVIMVTVTKKGLRNVNLLSTGG
ncbi:MAG: hypothetical protein DRJ26_00845 [Candidatus Methanomethylicota archaeon]|uniref:ArsR family transcriptional regulator n=1 Tax=Thermoproteota archaeon TaxID=2056631 RepID=A0A497EXV6_9CREN|nr:MAG: hypothetical protein DRJ20_01000 [Candidatus Verstraetearchaeota archaeon]RLE55372.1 MAG: hypothetical protein DRJ26_00845 [Candidatus Verstraetearchaeota archaeon]